jgi:hypothetical protein
MCKIISSPDAATGKTTAKKMTKTEIKKEEMIAIRECIEKEVRPLAEMYFQFEKSVDAITEKEKSFGHLQATPNFIVRYFVSYLCDKIIHSRMSADDKVDMLNRLNGLVYYCQSGGMLTAYSEDEEVWDRVIRDTADSRIEKYEKSNKD